jgi:hypothetical protein
VWVEIVMLAHDLLVWTQALLLDGELANAEPKRLRYQHLDARSDRLSGRWARLHLQATWPRASQVLAAFSRAQAAASRHRLTPAANQADSHCDHAAITAGHEHPTTRRYTTADSHEPSRVRDRLCSGNREDDASAREQPRQRYLPWTGAELRGDYPDARCDPLCCVPLSSKRRTTE